MDKKYSIGDASKACNIPIKTLRYYDEIDLLKPEYRNTESNYRYYSKEQLTTLLIIRRLRAQGFSLKNIKDLIDHTSLDNLEEHMTRRCEELDAEINLLQAKKASCISQLERIHRGADLISSHRNPPSVLVDEITIEDIPKSRFLFTRELMKRYRNADVSLSRWTDIYEKCNQLGFHMISPVIVTFFNSALDQFLMKDCDVEFGVRISSDYVLPDEPLNIRDFGGFKAAVIYHIGPYSTISQSHIALIQWIHQNDYEVAGPASEEFIVSPLDFNDENGYVTKVMMPIK